MKQPFLIVVIALAAFTTGAFAASPELRAYAAATIGSADIIDGSIQSIDIKNGQVKAADLGASSVTSGKIKDGEIKAADMNKSFIAVEHKDDCNCGGTGWDPDGTSNTEIIYDDRISPNSAVIVTGIFAATNYDCVVEDPEAGSVKFACSGVPVPDGFEINYAIFNPG